jgi:PadR family transcriptional regulator, regulatory protein PadR
MTAQLRLSHQRLKVLARFFDQPGDELSGADIMRLTSLASGSLYPILYVFEEGGLLKSRWETEDPQALGRPRRRLYKLTALGERTARAAAADFAALMQPFPIPSKK